MDELEKIFKRRIWLTMICYSAVLGILVWLVAWNQLSARFLARAVIVSAAIFYIPVWLVVKRWNEARETGRSLQTPLDDHGRSRTRRKIWLLQGLLVVFVLSLFSGLWSDRGHYGLPDVVGIIVNLVFSTCLLLAIRGLREKLKLPAGSNVPFQRET